MCHSEVDFRPKNLATRYNSLLDRFARSFIPFRMTVEGYRMTVAGVGFRIGVIRKIYSFSVSSGLDIRMNQR